MRIGISGYGIRVSNNLQPRNCVSRNGTGLRNLQHQYELYNKRIETTITENEFAVQIPFLDRANGTRAVRKNTV